MPRCMNHVKFLGRKKRALSDGFCFFLCFFKWFVGFFLVVLLGFYRVFIGFIPGFAFLGDFGPLGKKRAI